MSDGTQDPTVGAGAGTSPPADGWEELRRQLSELGSTIVATVRAAADDPENRRRAQELKQGLETLAREVGDAVAEATSSEHGQRVKEAAEKVAEAGRRVADDVRPHLIDAARKAGDALRETAARMEQEPPAAASGDAPSGQTPDTGDVSATEGRTS